MKQFLVVFFAIGFVSAAPSLDKVHKPLNSTIFYHPTIEGRIVGGEPARIEDLPWQVALLRNGAQICGGVLGSPTVVITAAHCVVPSVISAVSQLNIRSGSTFHNSGGLRVAVSRIIYHELYQDCDECPVDFDIAVLHLVASAITNVPAAPIPLWDASTVFPAGIIATVSGWGALVEDGRGSLELLRVDVPVVAEAQCRRIYGSIISVRTVCAGFAAGGRDACQGDSGGPFVIQGRLAGVVSFGAGCARPGLPGVYSSIPGYRSWIQQHGGI